MLRRACRDAAQWEPGYKVAVNLSGVQLAHANLPELVQRILAETGLQPDRLELELTETAVVKDKVRSLHFIRQIKALGVSVALDDFGTGYSSLETLRTFPFDKIKLDRSFVEGLSSDPRALAIIRAVLALGRSLSIPVLAEGIETRSSSRCSGRRPATRRRATCSGAPVKHGSRQLGPSLLLAIWAAQHLDPGERHPAAQSNRRSSWRRALTRQSAISLRTVSR